MPTVMLRIFLLYKLLNSFLLSLFPNKLVRAFLPRSCSTVAATATATATAAASPSPPIAANRKKTAIMDRGEMKRVFQMFDKDGDGRISEEELGESLENMGISIPEGELRQMIERIDVDGDGCVDMEEFGEMYSSMMEGRGEEEEADLVDAFGVFDQDGDGFITVEELRAVLMSLGLKQGMTAEDCRRMIMTVDADGDGMVNYKEFRHMMKGGVFHALA